MKLSIEEAHVKSVTIEIKVLTVSNKQVTLAVFRQLIEEECFNGEGTPFGVLWGKVNYCPGKGSCENGFMALTNNEYGAKVEHDHVIWQKSNELRRWSIPCSFDDYARGCLVSLSGRLEMSPGELVRYKNMIQKKKEVFREIRYQISILPQLFIAI
jgi:hypothetical protein